MIRAVVAFVIVVRARIPWTVGKDGLGRSMVVPTTGPTALVSGGERWTTGLMRAV